MFKNMLIENESEYKKFILNEINDSSESDELLRLLNKIMNLQYYKGLFYESDEYDEIISSKINELIESDELKYFLIQLLDAYDLFISNVKIESEIYASDEIITKYLIELYESRNIYLDEIDSEYMSDIIAYESKSDLEYYIDELISCYLLDSSNNDNMIFRYFNYDEYISDMLESDELIEVKNNYKISYVIDYNKFK